MWLNNDLFAIPKVLVLAAARKREREKEKDERDNNHARTCVAMSLND